MVRVHRSRLKESWDVHSSWHLDGFGDDFRKVATRQATGLYEVVKISWCALMIDAIRKAGFTVLLPTGIQVKLL
jgi:hypothetical protein